MDILIKVTKEVLEKTKMCGAEAISENCAIAFAIREIFPISRTFTTEIAVYQSARDFCKYISKGSGGYIAIPLPLEAVKFISDFDLSTSYGRTKMQPFSFTISVPDSVIEKIGLQEVYKVLSESKTLEMVMP